MIYVIPNPGQPTGEHKPQGTGNRTESGHLKEKNANVAVVFTVQIEKSAFTGFFYL